ncbi:hypothetical protein COU36_03655 [Candidatus Micrarchaeota archaeon CG10_big_fil_rev_8_21_14_0_10_59_7]|nr:MAG: hypothetical protein COU36_03655 [Candidatus Micrarchaeota archaeon CG10_big_fil_rev_8_21_14_0_10_59_7]
MRRLLFAFLMFAPMIYAIPGCNDFVIAADSGDTFVPFSITEEGRYNAVRFVSVFDNAFGTAHKEFLVVANNVAGAPLPEGTIFLPITNLYAASLFDYATKQQNNTVAYFCGGVQTDTWTIEFLQSFSVTTNATISGKFLRVSSPKTYAFAFDYSKGVSSSFYVLAAASAGRKAGTVFFETEPGVFEQAAMNGVVYVACCTNECEDANRRCSSKVVTTDDFCTGATTLTDFSCVEDACVPKKIECAFGCEVNGCLPGNPYCNDSDKGALIFNKGYAEGVDDTYARFNETDACISDYKLREYDCMGHNLSATDFDCFYGCYDGACRQPPKPTVMSPVEGTPTLVPEAPRTAEDNTALQVAGAIALLAMVLALGYADFAKRKK